MNFESSQEGLAKLGRAFTLAIDQYQHRLAVFCPICGESHSSENLFVAT